MQEFEDLEGFGVGGAGAQEEQLVLYDRVEECRGIRVREVDQRGARFGMCEVQREEGAAGGGAADVCVFEERCAASRELQLPCCSGDRDLLVFIKDVQSLDGAHDYAGVTWKPCARRVVVGLELVGLLLAGSCEGDDARRQGCPALAWCRLKPKLLTHSTLTSTS